MTYQPHATPEPLATDAREALPVVAYLVTGLAGGVPSICFGDERGDYGDEDHMPVFTELTSKPDAEAEIARLRADAERYRLLRRGQHWSVIDGIGNTLRAEALDAAIDKARSATSREAT